MGRTKAPGTRINMLFEPDTYDFIQIMAKVRGQTMTEFVNDVIHKSMDQNKELYEAAKRFRDEFK